MPLIDSQKLNEKLSQGDLSSLYLLFGDEPFLIDQALGALREQALEGVVRDFNLDVFIAGDTDTSQVRDTVELLPMMSSRRVVVFKEVHQLKERDWDNLLPVLLSPPPSTIFIMTAMKLDKRKKGPKTLLDKGVAVEFKKPYDNQVPRWIHYIASLHGLRLNEESIRLMHRLLGAQLSEIDSEMRKLAVYLGERKDVRVEDVAAVVSRVREESVFAFTDSIASKDRSEALISLVQLLDQGQSEIGVVAMIARHVRILIAVQEGLKRGLGGHALASHAGVPPYFVEKYSQQARRWSLRKLEDTLLLLGETDRALKSSPISSAIWLENLVLKSCQV